MLDDVVVWRQYSHEGEPTRFAFFFCAGDKMIRCYCCERRQGHSADSCECVEGFCAACRQCQTHCRCEPELVILRPDTPGIVEILVSSVPSSLVRRTRRQARETRKAPRRFPSARKARRNLEHAATHSRRLLSPDGRAFPGIRQEEACVQSSETPA
jgi:hypothetical protein